MITTSWFSISNLDRRKKGNKDVGYIYIMRNRLYKEPIIKIGKTGRPPWFRRQELSSDTGVPDDFELVYYVAVAAISHAEMRIHQELRDERYNPRKEFFKTSINKAIRLLDAVAEQLPIRTGGSALQPIFLGQDLTEVVVKCPSCSENNRVKQVLIKIRPTCPKCQTKYDLDPAKLPDLVQYF